MDIGTHEETPQDTSGAKHCAECGKQITDDYGEECGDCKQPMCMPCHDELHCDDVAICKKCYFIRNPDEKE